MTQGKWGVRATRIHPTREKPKDNYAVPFLGISENETRDMHGQLVIRLASYGREPCWIVIGKYAEPRPDGNQFYVSVRKFGYLHPGVTTYHEELLMAVTRAIQAKEEFENDHV